MKKQTALWMGLLVGAFGSIAVADSQRVVDVKSIQGLLEQTHAGWRAKESWVTRLSKDEIHRLLGVEKVTEGTLDYRGLNLRLDGKADAFDWRNVNGVNWVGSVMNQGNCG